MKSLHSLYRKFYLTKLFHEVSDLTEGLLRD